MSLLPSLWSSDKKKTEVISSEDRGLVVKREGGLTPSRGGSVIQARSKSIKIGKDTYLIDPQELIRMIRRVTQDVGAYKGFDGPYAAIVLGALRKARGDMVSLLAHHFHIHWHINDEGESEFTLG